MSLYFSHFLTTSRTFGTCFPKQLQLANLALFHAKTWTYFLVALTSFQDMALSGLTWQQKLIFIIWSANLTRNKIFHTSFMCLDPPPQLTPCKRKAYTQGSLLSPRLFPARQQKVLNVNASLQRNTTGTPRKTQKLNIARKPSTPGTPQNIAKTLQNTQQNPRSPHPTSLASLRGGKTEEERRQIKNDREIVRRKETAELFAKLTENLDLAHSRPTKVLAGWQLGREIGNLIFNFTFPPRMTWMACFFCTFQLFFTRLQTTDNFVSAVRSLLISFAANWPKFQSKCEKWSESARVYQNDI